MKISGVATINAPAAKVWAALNDPAVLVATIPGSERLEPTGPDSYRITVTAGVASIQGTYTGEVSLSDKHEPSSFVLTARGAGSPGTVSTTVQVKLVDVADGRTELSYDADAVIGGMIAGVGQRMLSSVAKKMAGQFFAAVDDVLTGAAIAGQPQEVALPSAGQPAVAGQPASYVAPRPAAADGQSFTRGVVVGAAVALAGVAVGALVGRRTRLCPDRG
jgi:carbon monoxide dehydrogenase subunit G